MSKNFSFAVFSYFCGMITIGMKILVLSETDACCGPMAAAFLRDYSPSLEVVSAGDNPSETVEPLMVMVMKECLADLSGYQPKRASDFSLSDFDAVYRCPDCLSPKSVEAYRRLRDDLKNETYLFFRHL